MKEYKGYYLPTRRHKKPREHKFTAKSDIKAAISFARLCYDAKWKMLNLFTEGKKALFTNGVLNVG